MRKYSYTLLSAVVTVIHVTVPVVRVIDGTMGLSRMNL